MRRTVEREVRAEMQGHFEELVRELQSAGMNEARARREAQRRFGVLETHYRAGRQVRLRALRGALLTERTHGMLRDVTSAYRALRARPAFALSAAALLGLGIGSATLLSSLVDSILLRPLPFDAPEQLFHIHGPVLSTDATRGPTLTPEQVLDWRPVVERSFSEVAAYYPRAFGVNVSGVGAPAQAGLSEVTTNFFGVLGQRMIIGRYFTPAERLDAPPPVVIGERLWRSNWNADPEILGKVLLIDGRPHHVVGVAPSQAQLPADVDVWVPLGLNWDDLFITGARYFFNVGRLRPGVSLDTARADLRLLKEHFSTATGGRFDPEIRLQSLQEDLVSRARSPLWLAGGGVSLLLLIALANLAGYLLVRSRAREAEYAVRAALGAGRRRLLQQSLAESGLLTFAGLIVACLLAAWSVGLVRSSDLPLPRLAHLAVDLRLVGLATGVSTLCALVLGLGPALVASRPDLGAALGAARRDGGGARRSRDALVVAQVALAFVLAAGAGLLVRSHERLLAVDNGFDGDVLTFATRLDLGSFPEFDDARVFVDEVTLRLRSIPGVRDVGAANLVPLADRNWFGLSYEVEGETPPEDAFSMFVGITPGFLEATGVERLAGRMFGDGDRSGTPRVAIVNEAFVRVFTSLSEPHLAVGRQMTEARIKDPKTFEIVGVVTDIRRSGPDSEILPEVYFPFDQARLRPEFYAIGFDGELAPIVAAARAAVADLAPGLPVYDLQLLRERLHDRLAQPRLLAWLFSGFGFMSVLLASFGLYVVVAYWVTTHTHEIGVRLALGATRGQVFGALLRDGGARLAAGLAIGLGAYALLARLVDTSLLFSTGIYDPTTLAAVVLLVSAGTVAGIVGAALRAMRLDPVTALRID